MRTIVYCGPPSPEEFQRQLSEFMRQHFQGIRLTPFAKSEPSGAATEPSAKSSKGDFRFDQKPREVKVYLDRFVIQQEEAKKVLSVALCDHYHHVRMAQEGKEQSNYTKQNIILV